jgi:hypothetical protein
MADSAMKEGLKKYQPMIESAFRGFIEQMKKAEDSAIIRL